jgi:hypothetical protein
MRKCKLVILSVLGIVLVTTDATNAVDAPKLTFKFTKANVPGAISTYPRGINTAGVMVGQYYDSAGHYHGYILNGKKLTELDDPEGTAGTTSATGLNPTEPISVVGFYTRSSDGFQAGFLYKKEKYTNIPAPKAYRSLTPRAINDRGAIVGVYNDSNGQAQPFLLEGKKYTTLNIPGAKFGFATGINNAGWIVLEWSDGNGHWQGSLTKDSGKTYKTINVPGAADSFPGGVNTAGDIIFEWHDSSGVAHCALSQKGKYYKFNYPKAVTSYAIGLNDESTVIGGYQLSTNDPYSGFKATY